MLGLRRRNGRQSVPAPSIQHPVPCQRPDGSHRAYDAAHVTAFGPPARAVTTSGVTKALGRGRSGRVTPSSGKLTAMGYEVRILRGGDRSERVEIPMQEWMAAVDRAGDLTLTNVVEASTPSGETVRYENAGLAEWSGHPSGVGVPFDFRRGQIVVNRPDEATIARMVLLAAVLGARVQGDDGEVYG